MKFLEDGTYIIRFGELYKVEFPKPFLDGCNKVVIPNWKAIPVTNAQKIRSMTDEELATFLSEYGDCPCVGGKLCERGTRCEDAVLMWLKQEATDA